MWFSVEALYKCVVVDSTDDQPIFERKIFLIDVPVGSSSVDKANKMAKMFEDKYLNSKVEQVSWQLEQVLDIQDLCEKDLYDGVEVFARLDVE